MKKLFFSILVASLMIGSSLLANGTGAPTPATASTQDYVVGGFEASGHIFTGAGWQRYKTNGTLAAATGSVISNDINGTLPGVLGEYTDTVAGTVNAINNNKNDFFKFFVDEVELDIAKTFGENIRVRADLDFGSQTLFSGPRFGNPAAVNVLLEQAYITANIAFGDGLEVLVGRFNSPLGFESVDAIANDTISRSIIYRALRPHSFTGVKVFYRFSDFVDWATWVANNPLTHDTGDTVFVGTDIPAVGTKIGFHWGEDGRSSLAFGGAWGQDHPGLGGNLGRKNAWSFYGSSDWNVWVSDDFRIGGEAIWRQIDTFTAGSRNGKYIGGLLNFHYDFSDVWDGTLKYAYAHDINGAFNLGVLVPPITGGVNQTLTGITAAGVLAGLTGQQYHEFALAANYLITEGARLRLEGGYTLIQPAGINNNQHAFGFAGAFGYEF